MTLETPKHENAQARHSEHANDNQRQQEQKIQAAEQFLGYVSREDGEGFGCG